MTPEERIAQLEAELARERTSRERMERALEDAMAAVRAAADDRRALEARRTADRERKNASRIRRLGDVSRDRGDDLSRDSHVTPPSPSLPPPSSSPSLSAPISPPPISSPNPSPPPLVSPSAPPRNELRLEPQEAPRQVRKPRARAPRSPTDPRHAPLTQELVASGWAHHGGRTAKAVAELLQLAAQGGHEGDAGHHEIVRRATIARAHDGFPRVRELHELVPNWGHFAEVPRRNGGGPAPPSSWDLSKELPPPPDDDGVPL